MEENRDRSFLIRIESRDIRPVVYLDGYLTALHDAGGLRRDELSVDLSGNHVWRVDKLNPNFKYSSLSPAELERDLDDTLKMGLKNYLFHTKPYTIQVERE